MTASRLVAAWVAAAATVATFAFGIVSMFGDAEIAQPRSDIVAIGSSLMAHAVPITGQGANSLLGDGRSHLRIAQIGGVETDVLRFVEEAINRNTSLVLVEANPLVMSLSSAVGQRPCDGPSNSIRLFLGRQQLKVRSAVQRLLGRPTVFFYDAEPTDLHSPQRIDPLRLQKIHGLVLQSPCDEPRVKSIVAQARAHHTRIVLVLIPRSPTYDAALGRDSHATLVRHAQATAARLGLEFFTPTDAWSDTEFADQSHMNALGRQHFLLDLKRWWMSVR